MLNFITSNYNFKNKKIIIGLLFLIGLFIAISIYYYKKIILPRLNKKYVNNNEFTSENNNNNNSNNSNNNITSNPDSIATLYYFYTNWCPYCKIAKPHLDNLKNEIQGNIKVINIIFKEIDCDEDTNLADKFKINQYPTIKLIYNNTIYDYDAKPDKDTLFNFLNSVL